MSKIRAAALGRKHVRFASDMRVTVVGGGPTKDHGRVLVNPADLEVARGVFRPSLLDRVLAVTGDGFCSVFASLFQGIAVRLGIVAVPSIFTAKPRQVCPLDKNK